MASQAQILGTPIPFVWEEEVPTPGGGTRKRSWALAVHARTFEMESMLQLWLEERELAFVRRNRKNLSQHDYDNLLIGCARDAAAGEFEFGSERVFKVLARKSGWVYNAWLQLRPSDTGLPLEVVERIWDDAKKMQELDQLIDKANGVFPPTPPPEAGATGSSPDRSASSPSPPPSPENPGS